jgi:hypothetical protein
MAYDLLTRRQTPANWTRYSRRRPRSRGTIFLVEYTFAPEPLATTDAEKALVARLAVLKMRADAGDKKALRQWRENLKAVLEAKRRAARGDPRARRLVQVLSESGLFDGVQKMEA